MSAIFRRELTASFQGLSGYVFGAFLLLFGGIYTIFYNLQYGIAEYQYVLSSMNIIFLIIVPILTMGVIAGERRQRTDQLLYSLPLSMTQVVLGKYLAMLVLFALPMAVLSLYPLVLSAYGEMSFPAAYGAIAAFFLLGAALIAVGTFLSSVTESQAVSAGLCFVVMLLNYFLADLAEMLPSTAAASLWAFTLLVALLALLIWRMTRNSTVTLAVGVVLEAGLLSVYFIDSSRLSGLFGTVVGQLSLFERFNTFVDGVFDWTGVVYFLTVIGFFLFLTVQVMEKRRWSE